MCATHFATTRYLKSIKFLIEYSLMSTHYKLDDQAQKFNSQSKVKLTDLLSRINKEKKIERNRNLALSVAAVSAVTVFGIILSL